MRGAGRGQTNRLFRHDRLIVWNTARATFARWHDRAIAAAMLVALLAIVRAGLADLAWAKAAWVTAAAGTAIGIGAGRLITSRLAFHAFDGLLAADALQPPMRWRYMAAWHGIALALLLAVILIARPALLAVGVPAYLAGALAARLTAGLRLSTGIMGTTRPGWTIRSWSHRPLAGAGAAAILLLSLLPVRALGINAMLSLVGIGTALPALMLAGVDDAVVRFMTIAGHETWRIVVRHTKGLASFLALAVPGAGVMIDPVAAGIAAAVGAATLLLLTLRILAYRLHARRFADLLVTILAGLFLLVVYAMPVALPVVALAMIWHLQRRAGPKTWLLA